MIQATIQKNLHRIDKVLERLAFGLLALSLFFMLGLTLTNVVARWFHTTFLWIDPAVRHLVFLSAFMGGVLATGKGSHIKIDVAGRALEAFKKPALQKALSLFIGLGSITACFFLMKAGYDFAKIEFEFGKVAFLGIHSGWLVSIIPFGFAFIGVRFVTVILLLLTKKGGE